MWLREGEVVSLCEEVWLYFYHAVLRGKDPSAVAVLMEDSAHAAVTSVVIASASILMTYFTGNHVYDGI